MLKEYFTNQQCVGGVGYLIKEVNMTFCNFRLGTVSMVNENIFFITVSILGYFMNLIFGTLANVRF